VEETRVARRRLAERIAEAIMNRHWTGVHAIGVLGSIARGDDDEYSDLNVGVVTTGPSAGSLRSIVRRVDGAVVHLEVRSVDAWLDAARTLTPEWPLDANRFLIAQPIYDPSGWYPVLREAHLARLREATDAEFARLARAALLSAIVYTGRARREFVRSGADDTAYLLTHAALRTALVTGLLERTRFRHRRDALRRTGLARPTLDLLEERHRALEAQLALRGAPIDSEVEDLVSTMGVPPVDEPRVEADDEEADGDTDGAGDPDVTTADGRFAGRPVHVGPRSRR
jgi:predicted nucleotidyltransferase